MSEVKSFDLKRAEDQIELSLEDGSLKRYVIREMTGAQRDMYLKTVMSKAKFDSEGKVTQVSDPTGLQPSLICLCLYDAATGNAVDVKFVNSMRTTVQNQIFELCSKINGLDKESADNAKNE